MTEIPASMTRQSSLRTSTTILKSILTQATNPEPGAIPMLGNDAFNPSDSFVANIARIVMDMRSVKATAVTKAPSPAANEISVQSGKTISISRNDVAQVYGDSGADKITLTAHRVDYVSARGGDDEITVDVSGDEGKTAGMSAIDSGSATRIFGGDGKDKIDVTAEQLASDIQGGEGDDVVRVKASYASRITGGGGDDKVSVNAHSVDGVDGNLGNDEITIVATLDETLDELLNTSIGAGNVSHVTAGNGKDTVTINADKRVSDVDVGTDDDQLTIHAQQAFNIKAGGGNDTLDLTAQTIHGVDAGTGNDTVIADSRSISDVSGGYGNDRFDLHGAVMVNIDGGAGDDEIRLTATPRSTPEYLDAMRARADFIQEKMASLMESGMSGDELDAALKDLLSPPQGDGTEPGALASIYSGISGGDGKDRIVIDNMFGQVLEVSGGNGNDEIRITANEIRDVSGGRGDDTLVLATAEPGAAVSVYFAEGDGNDTIKTTSDIEIHRYSADGTRELGLKDATFVKTAPDTYKLTFKGSKDSITINFWEPGIAPECAIPVIDGNTIRWQPNPDWQPNRSA